MKKVSWLLVLSFGFLLILSSVGCNTVSNTPSATNVPKVESTEIMVSAAASMKDSLTEIQKAYAEKTTGVKLTFVFGASGTLQQQIEQGAPVDLFISAGKTQMDALEQKNLLLKESKVDLVGNELVLVTGKDNNKVTSLEDLTKPDVDKISIGTPESVPAGKYAQESLTNLKLWDALKPKFVLAKDVTQVLNYVETGNVEAGLVYKSDAQGSAKVKVVSVVPESSHKAIVYPAAVISATKNKQVTEDFLKYLESSEAQQIFVKYGFKTLAK
ncbi:molybdate ABC transporter substrate-binding protein [Desulfosporosinus lacus]|uniref:Molybdate transport system substrate-binding protein n=1 Tax=Desulfosporosinus lacus DSM 15449 TaxID=1121420 RepID=A0A1M5Z7B2_9FIRM|nr:molybdate ABC transporter substrate-binding protein [Desulfosporosinus lacus]SHI20081.1 molybdate transport system substrate-binding protein [Desulfosporosinus lacus DSM 15449]